MTVLEFWGCALITFGPALAMFTLTVAQDPIKVILLISSSFFWLMSFLLVAMSWAVISLFCDYLIIGAILAVLSQEMFRYIFSHSDEESTNLSEQNDRRKREKIKSFFKNKRNSN